MKKYVINLPNREDRLSRFMAENKSIANDVIVWSAFAGKETSYKELVDLGFDTYKHWRDPILGRGLTKGEIGCFISHFQLWQQCVAAGEPFAIFEDDTRISNPHRDWEKDSEAFDLFYLTHKEMIPEGAEKLENGLVAPCYPYWLAAYVITPEAAQQLIETGIEKNIIPCDEYVPRMLDRINVGGYEVPIVDQHSRELGGTDIEPTSEDDYVRDFTTHVFTCGDDVSRMSKLEESSDRLGISVGNVLDGEWGGGSMLGPGGGQKLNNLLSYIVDNQIPDQDVILFTDAFDVFYLRDLDTIVGRFLGFKTEIVFSAEQHLWPDESLAFPPTGTPYRYLNSGTFIGRAGEIKRIIGTQIPDHSDDQLYLQKAFLSGRFKAVLDTEGYIFQTHDDNLEIVDGEMYNPRTLCYPCVYHGNGGEDAKATLDRYFNQIYPPAIYAKTTDFEVIGQDMLLIDCFSESQCLEWIQRAEEHGGFEPHPDDRFPSHDIHLKLLGLWEEMEQHWKSVIAPICERYWVPYTHYHLRKAFVMKYAMDQQRTLGHHTDASLVTGSVKLNDDYEGATLIFPRQQVTNKDVPIGKMILFPGQVTHGHYVDPLTKGTKYSATFWTARYSGDYLDPDD